MAVLLLIRHGQNDTLGKKLAGRLPGVHLNQAGQDQAERLALELSSFPIKAIYASPLERARETAQPIAQAHNQPIQTLPALLEIDFGSWEGQGFDELKQESGWKIVHEQPSAFIFPGGEGFPDAQERAVQSLVSLSRQYSEKDLVVCVTHSDVIRLVVAHFLDLPLDNFQKIRIAPASLTVLYLNENQAFFGPINYTFTSPQL